MTVRRTEQELGLSRNKHRIGVAGFAAGLLQRI